MISLDVVDASYIKKCEWFYNAQADFLHKKIPGKMLLSACKNLS